MTMYVDRAITIQDYGIIPYYNLLDYTTMIVLILIQLTLYSRSKSFIAESMSRSEEMASIVAQPGSVAASDEKSDSGSSDESDDNSDVCCDTASFDVGKYIMV